MRRRAPRTGRESFGDFIQLDELPGTAVTRYRHFMGGYVSNDTDDATAEASSPYALDMEVSLEDRLVRVPGVSLDEDLTKVPIDVFLHSDYNLTSELVFLAPPFIGIKGAGPTVWYDIGLAGGGRFSATNHAGVLVFSNGRGGLWKRRPREAGATLIPGAPAGRAITSFANRILVGHAVIDGNTEPMGFWWSGASSDPADIGEGSGSEFLISDVGVGDEIVAWAAIGFDSVVALCRNSIWLGRRTGDALRPVDMAPRIQGQGCWSAQSVRVTHQGVLFLSGDGLNLFDLNTLMPLSSPIDAELLPLEQGDPESYSSSFNPLRQRYYLRAPSGLWVLDLKRPRWSRRSYLPDLIVPFADQFTQPTWGSTTGTWGSQVGTWADTTIREEGLATRFILGNKLHREDSALGGNLGVALTPTWRTPEKLGQGANDGFQILSTRLLYEGSGIVRLRMIDTRGIWMTVKEQVLPLVAKPTRAKLDFRYVTRNMQIELQYASGFPEVSEIVLIHRPTQLNI